MASLENIPFEYWRPRTDDYELPDGRIIPGWRVRDARTVARDRRDAAGGYDPYNNFGRAA